jgi:CRP-like cAMP-binding protein
MDCYQCFFDYLDSIIKISVKEQEEIKEKFSIKQLSKGDIVLKSDEPLKNIFFNIDGIFRYFYIDYNGKEQTKYFCFGNEFVFSLRAFLSRSPSQFFIQSLSDCVVLEARVDVIYDLLGKSSYWKELYRIILENTYVKKEEREAEFLFNNAKQRYLNFLNQYPQAAEKIKQEYIAQYLGITPVSLSRIKNSL